VGWIPLYLSWIVGNLDTVSVDFYTFSAFKGDMYPVPLLLSDVQRLLLARKAKLPQLGVPSRLETLERILAGNILLKFSINSNLARVSKTFARLYLFNYLPPLNFSSKTTYPLE
jgi:hypothetical protein